MAMNRILSLLSLSLLSILLASPALAGEVLLPAVYRGAGANGTNWKTEIVVSNITKAPVLEPAHATITLHRDNGETKTLSLTLSQMEVYAIPDALFEWFDVESGGGIVRVTWDGNANIVARARIYNVNAQGGQYGQNVPGLPVESLVQEHFLIGLTGVDGNRTNVGVSNPLATDTKIWIELFDTSGESRGSFATIIPARSYRQFNDIFDAFQAGPLNAAMIRVLSTDTPVYAYASIVRNDTGDATFVTTP